MRSRYSAYALGLVEYIQATTHPGGPHFETDSEAWARSIRVFSEGTHFRSLAITDHGEEDDQGWVTFTAGLEQAGQDAGFTERSTFERIDGRWLYRDGERLDGGP